MKTPYDTALRALHREIDDMRTAIGTAAEQVTVVEAKRQSVVEAIARESALASGDWTIPLHGYLVRARAERERLAHERRAAEIRLDTLRDSAAEKYGSLRAVEGAADSFREEAGRMAAAAEQAGIDDFAGARFARQLRLARAAPGRVSSAR